MTDASVLRVRIVGRGRLGSALAAALFDPALIGPARIDVDHIAGRGEVEHAAAGRDLIVLAVPDSAIASVAAAIRPVPGTVVAHASGALDLDVLAPHERRASMHPLVSITSASGATALGGAWFALDGDPLAEQIVAALGGRSFRVRPADRARYHAAAVVASNHLVALLGQVERLAASVGVPFEAFFELAVGSLENVAVSGAWAALTGPVIRGDWDTVERHLAALPADELEAYRAGVIAAARLADRPLPAGWQSGAVAE